MSGDGDQARRGRLIALVIASTGILWVGGLAVGDMLAFDQRMLALIDMAALGGFAMAMWLLFGLWRARRINKD